MTKSDHINLFAEQALWLDQEYWRCFQEAGGHEGFSDPRLDEILRRNRQLHREFKDFLMRELYGS